MKEILNKKIFRIILALILLTILDSCAFTRSMWGGGDYDAKYDEIGSFFIDKESNKVVLIGEAGYKTKIGTYHYSISEPIGKFSRVFELGQKSAENDGFIGFEASSLKAKGNKMIDGVYAFGIGTKGLSPDESKYLLKDIGLRLSPNKQEIFVVLSASETARYPSSKEPVKNLCSYEQPEYREVPNEIFDEYGKYKKTLKEPKLQLISQPKPKPSNTPDCIPITFFDSPWKGLIKDQYTLGKQAGRVALTPLAIAADIVLTPLYLIGIIGMGFGGR